MPWVLIVLAGFLEAGWAVGLKHTDGFTRLWPSILTGLTIALSLVLLSLAARHLPIGTAYAVWVGIGALGAAVWGILRMGEPVTPARMLFLALLLLAIVGLKATASVNEPSAADAANDIVGPPSRGGLASALIHHGDTATKG